MRTRSGALPVTVGLVLAACASLAQDQPGHPRGHGARHVPGPYAGQQDRAVASLSDEEVRGLLAGHGVGMARPAELQHYPGPRHVLDLSDELSLSATQLASVEEVYRRMRDEALPLGARYVEHERLIDALFASGTAEDDSLRRAIEVAERLRGRLRFVHLRAHVETRRLLSPAQVARYDELRGYRDD